MAQFSGVKTSVKPNLNERDCLGDAKGGPAGHGTGDTRNDVSAKTVLTEDGEVEIAVPRDRAGTFEPQLILKGQTRFDGFDDKILSLYARGISVREIQEHLSELYGTDVSPELVSPGADLHCASDPQQPRLRHLDQDDLSG